MPRTWTKRGLWGLEVEVAVADEILPIPSDLFVILVKFVMETVAVTLVADCS